MSVYLAVSNITKSYNIQPVLANVSFVLNAGERIGLVGANGVGKSTLLKIITGGLEADSGTITLTPNLRVGYLEQTISSPEDQTLDALIAAALDALHALERRMRDLEGQMAVRTGAALDAVFAEYGLVSEQFERSGGYELAYQVDRVLDGLRVGHIPRQRQFATLSGGEKARVGLALLLLQSPDVLLLDEPTNHLDFASLEWLEGYLSAYRGGILIVSHDRHFLNRTVNAILEIDEHSHSARRYAGDYDAYHRAKIEERRKWEWEYARQQEEIKDLKLQLKVTAHSNSNYRAHRDNDKFIVNIKKATHANTVSKRVHAAEEKLSRIEENPIPQPPAPLRFTAHFDPQALKGRLPLVVSGLSKRYGTRQIFDDLSFTLGLSSRVVLVGENGAGKSTLLKILVGAEAADHGEIYFHPAVKIGYLDQEQRLINPGQTVLEAFRAGLDGTDQQHIAALLHSGLFRYDELSRLVGQLSAGQQRKLQIARLIAEGANLLVLDEPTNYVSFDVLEELETALKDFPGPIIAASHDRRFIQHFEGDVWELRDAQLVQHLRGLEDDATAAVGEMA